MFRYKQKMGETPIHRYSGGIVPNFDDQSNSRGVKPLAKTTGNKANAHHCAISGCRRKYPARK
jgi:hypothetical protein